MKRFFCCILILILSLTFLTSCGKLSEENLGCAKSVLEATDYYLDGLIAPGTAVSALELFKSSVKSEGKKSEKLISLMTDISNALLDAIESRETSELLNARNALAKFIGDPIK
ncbi:MAG: hypothetical protein IKK29_07760 [Christensenellaceae bacterium]|nr:hypothetical protein [Christensenellaceae bacterium]